MKINIMTLFPEMFEPIRSSMIGRAIDNGIIELNIVNIILRISIVASTTRLLEAAQACLCRFNLSFLVIGRMSSQAELSTCRLAGASSLRRLLKSLLVRASSQSSAGTMRASPHRALRRGDFDWGLCADGWRAARDGASRCGCQIYSWRAGIR